MHHLSRIAIAAVVGVLGAAEPHWEALPLRTPAQAAAGIPGGEGCQYPCTIVADQVDGGLLLYGTDVGGIFRSEDRGATWHPCDLGMKANGVISVAIDPRNREHVLAIGSVSGNRSVQADGVYLSSDGGRRWSQVLSVPRIEKTHDALAMVAWDAASADPGGGGSRRAYASIQFSPDLPGGLFRSEDGGATWTRVAEGAAYGGDAGEPVFIAVHPGSGALLVGGAKGLRRSTDHGRSFAIPSGADGAITGLCVLGDRVWTTGGGGLRLSSDGGLSFAAIPQDGERRALQRLSVSPADPRRMAARDGKTSERMISHDGGRTWTASTFAHAAEEFFPDDVRSAFKDRQFTVAWHPTDPALAWSIGPGDLVTASRDGGLTWQWANNGINNIMIGGLFNFSAQDPDVLYFGSQDYNGGLTSDGGRTWRLANLTISNTRTAVRQGGDDSDTWGWVYGAYSPDGQVLFGGNMEYQGKHHDLWISFDGGKTSERKVQKLAGIQVSYGDPRDPAVLFCWGMRSADRGRSWTRMAGCDGVFTASAGPGRTLYGARGGTVVASDDHGATWKELCSLGGTTVRDVAVDHVANRLWVAGADNQLYRCDAPAWTPAKTALLTDHFGHNMPVSTVAVDPVDPRIVYVGACGTGLWVQRDASVARSLDGGATWERLTCNPKYLAGGWETGAQMTSALRVHPGNRWLYAATCCYGWWRFPPPPADLVGTAVVDARYAPPLAPHAAATVPDIAVPVPGPDGLAVKVLRDFAHGGVDYAYGPVWKCDGAKANVAGKDLDGARCLVIDASEHGGAGLVLGGIPVTAQGQTHLVVYLRPLPGNQADALAFNLKLAGGGERSLRASLAGLPGDRFSPVLLPLPGDPAAYQPVDQVQIQGCNFSDSARPLHVAIRRIGTTCPPAGWTAP